MYGKRVAVGVDIGSATSKAVLLADGVIAAVSVSEAGAGTDGPRVVMEEVLRKSGNVTEDVSAVVATGYGRLRFDGADMQVSEMSCHARGAAWMLPGVDTVLDIGGQDVKVLRLDADGYLTDFVMNDKCAAGTGRFLEIMARMLETPVGMLEALAADSTSPAQISNICAVFAESEVVSRVAAGERRADICAGIHKAVALRAAGLIRRLPGVRALAVTGGVARNGSIIAFLEQELGIKALRTQYPQEAGALGAALYAAELNR